MPVELDGGGLPLGLAALDAQVAEVGRAGLRRQRLQVDAPGGRAVEGFQVGHGEPGGDHQQAGVAAGQRAQQHGQPRVLELALLRPRRVLQRLQPVQHQQGPLALHQGGQPVAFVPRRAGRGVGVAEPAQRGVDELVGRGLAALGRALAVEGPAEDAARTLVVRFTHFKQPPVDQGRLAHAAPGDQAQHVGLGIVPGRVQAGQLGVAAEEHGAGDGQLLQRDFGRRRRRGLAGFGRGPRRLDRVQLGPS